MYRGYVIAGIMYAPEDVGRAHRMSSEHHALCQELATAKMVKAMLEKVWDEELCIEEVEWNLEDKYQSRCGKERIL